MATDLSNLKNFLAGNKTIPTKESEQRKTVQTIGEIYAEAEKIGISTNPIDIKSVIEKIFKIHIYETDLGKEVSGFLEKKGATWEIYLNKYESEVRKRFTLAHELGHYIYHRNKYAESGKYLHDNIYFRAEQNMSEDEIKANEFAASLLMPEEAFKNAVKSGCRKIIDLAGKFNVSTAAVKYRAYKLKMISEYR